MNALLRRAWDALFPIPNVSQLEAFLARALFAAVLYHFLPKGMEQVTQPVPVGLAHVFDLTWLSHAQAFGIFRLGVIAALFWFASGVVLPVALPVLTLLQVLPYTLMNSQGHPHHGFQIMSLTLLGMSVVSVAQSKSQTRPEGKRLALLAIMVVGAVALFDGFIQSGAGDAIAGWGGVFGEDGPGWVYVLVEGLVFVLLAALLARLAQGRERRLQPSSLLNASLLMTAQFVIAAAYLISVCSKLNRSGGQWLMNSPYVALDFVKTTRQSYYAALDPQFAIDPPGVVFLMTHENLARLFFGSGMVLESILILAVGTRWLAGVFGVSAIAMHCSIAALMTLSFPTHEAMMMLFFVNVPFLLAAVIMKLMLRAQTYQRDDR